LSENEQVSENIEEILEAVKQREDQERVIEIEEKTIQIVVILLDERYYAFYGECIKEIVPVGQISYVPGMPEYILGVISIRGEIESVLDLRRVLGLPVSQVTKQSKIMIGEVNDIRSGILVDSVEDVLEIPEEQISKPVSAIDSERTDSIVGEASYKDHELIILDLEKIFEKLLNY
jgi:purine-binding chemotaxis protein CheW